MAEPVYITGLFYFEMKLFTQTLRKLTNLLIEGMVLYHKKSPGSCPGFLSAIIYCVITDSSFRWNQLRHSLFSQTTRMGEALKIDE
jgi:hypothetical protein